MSSELFFTKAKDVESLKFSTINNPTKQEISTFKNDCRNVVEAHKKTVLSQCKLGLLLAELKESGTWKSVINTKTGYAFMFHSFEDFCDYAFEFGSTYTKDLLRISQFVRTDNKDEVFFIDEKYKSFNKNQLIELAAVPTGLRHYFTEDMTVEQFRTIKKYVMPENSSFWEDKQKQDFDLLTYATEFVEGKKKTKELPPPSDVLEGQRSLFSEDEKEDGADLSSLTSDLAEVGEAEKERVIKRALTRSEALAVRIYKKYKENPLHSELVNFIKEAYGNGGSWIDDIDLSYNAKGLTITKRTGNFKKIFTLFLSWAQVTQRIVTLINNDEYLSHTVKFAIDEQLKKAQANEPTDEYEPAEDEVWQGGGLDRDSDDYDEADEAQEDMQAEMQTIEAEAERSVFEAEKSNVGFSESPQKRYKFTTRDEIRFFLTDYKNWYFRDDLRTPFTKVGYWCTLKNFDIINVLEANTISNRSLLSEAEEIEEKGPIFFLHRAKYKDQPSVMIGKVQLEVYLMSIRDRL